MKNKDKLLDLLEDLEDMLRQAIKLIETYRKSQTEENKRKRNISQEIEIKIDAKIVNEMDNTKKYIAAFRFIKDVVGIETLYRECSKLVMKNGKAGLRQGKCLVVDQKTVVDAEAAALQKPIKYRRELIDGHYIITGNTTEDKKQILDTIVEHFKTDKLQDRIQIKLRTIQ